MAFGHYHICECRFIRADRGAASVYSKFNAVSDFKYMENSHLSEFLAVCAELNAEIAFTAAEIACRIEAAGVTDTNLRLKY